VLQVQFCILLLNPSTHDRFLFSSHQQFMSLCHLLSSAQALKQKWKIETETKIDSG